MPDPVEYAEALSLAFTLEASGYPKPGNVDRIHDLPGLPYEAFIVTGIVATKYLEKGVRRGIKGWGDVVFGDLVYGIVADSMRKSGSTNTCLGSSLLIAPLSVAIGLCLRKEEENLNCFLRMIREVLSATSVEDSVEFYRAVREARPSYIKPTDETGDFVNVWDHDYKKKLRSKKQRLKDVLEFSTSHDIVSHELVNGLPRSVNELRFLAERFNAHKNWNRAVVETYVHLLSREHDTVIAREHGFEAASRVRDLASTYVIKLLVAPQSEWLSLITSLDTEIRRMRVNPASVADITASTIALYTIDSLARNKYYLNLNP
ncbi:triphosphoribosyl-dephospho-CoA synthase [Thermosphaera chiliense]|uniref:triphosphoribosyl-dephospho-CoA synthase n=1 Tax=Thermosphaera chiliense TaxID=3402707 RepID=UPI001D0A8A3D|nr:triphosphoribosyl-dephospho-CoA synthase [Thermosphaera aggregans]